MMRWHSTFTEANVLVKMADIGIPVASSQAEGSPGTADALADNEALRRGKAQRRVSAAGDVSYHPGVGLIPLFAPPRQRQKWGDTQVLPRTNWGDIFFDLWFVAAAYNVGNIIVASPTGTGLLYFIGTFLPLIIKWQEKTYYDSRYATDDDLFHRFFEVAVLLVVSTAVVHVRPVEFMSVCIRQGKWCLSLKILCSNILVSPNNVARIQQSMTICFCFLWL